MSRRYEAVTETITRSKLVELRCDLCRKIADEGNWRSSSYDAAETEVTVKQITGDNYPGGGYGKEFSVDICPDCFQSKLIPWLISQGAEVNERDWDW